MRTFVLFTCIGIVSCLTVAKAQNVLPKNGFIGIQTTTPKVSLDVRGITFSNALKLGEYPVNTDAILHLFTNSTASDSILFLAENTERKLLELTSDGVLRSREIIIDAESNWPDYVFDDDYSLLSLKETENFININGHLPGVPSAERIQETGIDLGEMNRLLLEKVEELTLYVIQQQKEIDELRSLIEKE